MASMADKSELDNNCNSEKDTEPEHIESVTLMDIITYFEHDIEHVDGRRYFYDNNCSKHSKGTQRVQG